MAKKSNVIESKPLKNGFWTIKPILGTKSDINIVIGQRSNGKTYGCLKFFLEENKKTGRRFCYIRRWHEDVTASNMQMLFNPLQSEIEKIYGQGYTIYYYRGCFYLVDEKGKRLGCIGYVLDISTGHHKKSVPFVGVKYIILDEFIQMSSDEKHVPEEIHKWEQLLSSVIRTTTDVVIFLIANTVSKFSPYFTHYGFNINKCEQGYIYTQEYPIKDGILRVSLEYCAYSEIVGDKSSKYVTSKMVRTGAWEIPETSDIPENPGEKITEKLLFSMYDPDALVTVGCFIRFCEWYTIEKEENTLIHYTKRHTRQFLVLHLINTRSKYHHLSNEKSLDYNTFNDLEYMLDDIKETCDIDVMRELYFGRIFSDNMFTADYFIHCWTFYGMIPPRSLL